MPRVWLGAPNSIKGPTETPLQRQSGNHLLIVGQYDDSALALLTLTLIALAAQHPANTARFLLLDATPPTHTHHPCLQQLVQAIPHPLAWVQPAQTPDALRELFAELQRRSDPAVAAAAPSVYLLIHHLERFSPLRFEEDFALSLSPTTPTLNPGQQLNQILTEGAPAGLHVLASCDTYNNASRFLGRRALSEFELRVLFQMSASDSASLIDSPKAAALGLHRALLHNAQKGTLETFRPYALPDSKWLAHAAEQLARLVRTTPD
jgi:DNA segregation ATPase FtsK/SpoIIIE, S-DNA-T family